MKKSMMILLLMFHMAVFSETTPWRDDFEKIDHQALKHLLAGFDPRLEVIADNSPDTVHQGVTVYVHGWLGGKDAYNLRKRCNDNSKVPGDVIVFDFPDASWWLGQKIPYFMPITRSNFAQEGDIMTMLCVMKSLHNAGIKAPVYYAHSRGGAVITKTVGILNDPSEEWKEKLGQIKINKEIRKEILDSIKVIYLDTPLKDVPLAIRKRCEYKMALVTDVFPSLQPFASETLPDFMINKALPTITSFNPEDTKQPIDYLHDWKNVQATTVLHFQHADKDVPNDDDAKCARILLTAKPDNTYVIVGDDGGHDYGDKTLAKVIHRLNHAKGCSYKKGALSDGDELLSKKLNAENVEEYVTDAHDQFRRDNQDKYNKQWSLKKSLATIGSAAITVLACSL